MPRHCTHLEIDQDVAVLVNLSRAKPSVGAHVQQTFTHLLLLLRVQERLSQEHISAQGLPRHQFIVRGIRR